METGTLPAGATKTNGWCDWRDGPSGTAVEVEAIECASGVPHALYACALCREQGRIASAAIGRVS